MAFVNYNNLTEEKKKILLDAIMFCLKNSSYDNLSINDIVKQAGIARGSFYNYFEDKNDAVRTLVASQLYALEKIFKDTIMNSNGSLFAGTLKTYNLIIKIMSNQVYFNIVRNIQYFVEIATKIVLSNDFADELDGLLDWLLMNTIEGKTYLNSKKKMANIIEMIVSLFLNSTLKETIKPVLNTKYTDFEYKLKVIENGAKVA